MVLSWQYGQVQGVSTIELDALSRQGRTRRLSCLSMLNTHHRPLKLHTDINTRYGVLRTITSQPQAPQFVLHITRFSQGYGGSRGSRGSSAEDHEGLTTQ